MNMNKQYNKQNNKQYNKQPTKQTLFPNPCKHPNCPKITQNTYCEDHIHLLHQDGRASASKRGYGVRWRKYRETFILKNPLCTECLSKGITRRATVVDHVIPHKGSYDLFWDESNHNALCKWCHDTKTASEDMAWWDSSKGLR